MTKQKRSPWFWVPSLYYAEGIPYALVMMVSVIFYKRMGVSNTDIALYTSWLYLPWVIKPLWSPVVDALRTKRFWIIASQLIIALGLGGIALSVPLPGFFKWTLVFFWLLAFSSATHDIAVDGFYMLGLSKHDQAWFVGFRASFYRLAMITGQGLLIMLAGYLENASVLLPVTKTVFGAGAGNITLAWSLTFAAVCVLFGVFFIYHQLVLPFPDSDRPSVSDKTQSMLSEYWRIFAAYFKKDRIWIVLAFLLLYRFAEAQLVKMASPFLLDTHESGGLGLTTGEVGFVYGTVGIIMLSLGGLLGGIAASKHGLRYWLWGMALAINLPDLVYVYMAYFPPDNFFIINLCVAIEQLGYGFGFTAYMLYMIYASEGQHKTAHFAISTGFMALGMMIPGMLSGWLQELIGYQHFFIWVVIATIPGFIILPFLPLDPDFGKKAKEEKGTV